MATLHYAQSIFEGLKAYAQPDGSVATFRPEANAARFVRSAKRLAMPPVPEEAFIAAVDALVDADRDWVPTGADQTLYIRPYQMASEPFLGVRPAHEYLFLVIASPAGAYFPRGVQPVSVYLSEDYIRAAPGGTGDVKCAGNYAASLLAQEQAIAAGLRPGGLARRRGEALRRGDGRDEPVLRPRLRRRRRAGHPRAHRHAAARHHPRLADRRWPASWATRSPSAGSRSTSGAQGVADGTVTETFACGTAAVITPVGEVKARTGDFTVGDGTPGPLTMPLRETLLDIQHGRVADTHGWLHQVA